MKCIIPGGNIKSNIIYFFILGYNLPRLIVICKIIVCKKISLYFQLFNLIIYFMSTFLLSLVLSIFSFQISLFIKIYICNKLYICVYINSDKVKSYEKFIIWVSNNFFNLFQINNFIAVFYNSR